MHLAVLLATFAASIAGGPGYQERTKGDKIELANGQTLDGRVLRADDKKVVVRVDGRVRELEKKEVRSLDTMALAVRDLLAHLPAAGQETVDRWAELARYAKQHRLDGEEELLWWKVLLLDPNHQEAHERLGHRKLGKVWQAQNRKEKWLELDDLLHRAEDWNEGFELSTTHYFLRTNLPLDEAIRTLFLLERVYASWYVLWDGKLELNEETLALEWNVHRDERSFERLPGRLSANVHGYRPVQVDASRGLPRKDVIAGALRQVFAGSFVGPKESVTVPQWLLEGLPRYLAEDPYAETGPVVAPKPELPKKALRLHAGARDPFKLDRVLVFTPTDFLMDQDVVLKEAESTSLATFLMEAGDGTLREGLACFLKSVLAFAGTTKDLERCLGVQRPELERQWLEYVRVASKKP